jgi:hypothetical protein
MASKEEAMTNEFVLDLRARSEKSLTLMQAQRGAGWYIDLLKRRIASLDRLMDRRRKTGLA